MSTINLTAKQKKELFDKIRDEIASAAPKLLRIGIAIGSAGLIISVCTAIGAGIGTAIEPGAGSLAGAGIGFNIGMALGSFIGSEINSELKKSKRFNTGVKELLKSGTFKQPSIVCEENNANNEKLTLSAA